MEGPKKECGRYGPVSVKLSVDKTPGVTSLRTKAFTLLEFLVASFLALLLLTLIYEAFGEVSRFYRRAFEEEVEASGLVAAMVRWQFANLRGRPLLLGEGRYLALPVKGLLGPWWAIYDLAEGRYGEVPGIDPLTPENPAIRWFRGGIREVSVRLPGSETEARPLEEFGTFPRSRPLLLSVRLVSGEELVVVLP